MLRIPIPELQTLCLWPTFPSFLNVVLYFDFFQVMSYASLIFPTLSPPVSLFRSSPSSSSSREAGSHPGLSLLFHFLHPNHSWGRQSIPLGEAWIWRQQALGSSSDITE